MQCQSYFPVYHSNYDLNLNANSGARPIHNINGTFQSGHYSKYTSPVPQGPLELLRQTILMHEATFRDQVQELHRLYKRQKELIGELRSKEPYMNHLHLELEGQSSNSYSKYLYSGVQTTQHSLPLVNLHCKPFTVSTYCIETPLDSIKELKAPAPAVSHNESHLNNFHFPESKARKIGGKVLDLELPAEVYIDTEEGECLEDANPNPPVPTCLSSSKPSEIVVGTDLMASIALQGAFSSPVSFAKSNSNLADLNEPTTASCSGKNNGIIGNEETYYDPDVSKGDHDPLNGSKAGSDGSSSTPKFLGHKVDDTNPELCSGSSQRNPSARLEKNPCVVQALPCFFNQVPSRRGAKIMSINKGHVDGKLDGSSRCKSLKSGCSVSRLKGSVISLSSVTSEHLMHGNDLNDIDLNSEFIPPSDDTSRQSDSSSVHPQDGKTTRKRKKCRLIDINLPCAFEREEEPDIEADQVGGDYKNSAEMNLNSCMNDDEIQPKSTCSHKIALEIDLEAPPSPEVEEGPPPRGDSEENDPETHQIPISRDGIQPRSTCLELEKVAAETIVSMASSCKSEPYHEIRNLKICETSDSWTLEWFAGLIESISCDLENDSGTLNYDDTYRLDEFEAMTLELTEMKEEEYWCKNGTQIESIPCSMPLDTHMRKGRTRRSKRKDFQREVLPSLTSLSRYEVTEDIQMIEGLMEAAGTPWRLTRAKRACRMGRKPRAAKQPATSTSDVPELKGRALMSWGKTNRRPRGRRNPTSHSMVLTRWLAFSA